VSATLGSIYDVVNLYSEWRFTANTLKAVPLEDLLLAVFPELVMDHLNSNRVLHGASREGDIAND
jgi:hypothetical protein